MESFDRVVFESVVERIIIGGYNDEGVEEPLKITFVYKTGIHSNLNAKDFKPKRKNASAVHKDAELCSYTSDEVRELCLHSSSDTRRHRVASNAADILTENGSAEKAEPFSDSCGEEPFLTPPGCQLPQRPDAARPGTGPHRRRHK